MQSEQHMDLSISLSTLLLKNIGLWIAEDPTEEYRRKIMIAWTLSLTMGGMILEGRDSYFSWQYDLDALYPITNCLTITMALVKVYVILMHKTEFMELLLYMREKFWGVNHDFIEKQILGDCRRTCVFFITFVSIIGFCVMCCYITTPFIVQGAINISCAIVSARSGSNESERVLPFNLWLNLPLTVSPYYEMAFIIEVLCLYYIGVCYFCFDSTFCIMAVHLAGQFRMLQYRFTKLCDVNYEFSEKWSELAKIDHLDKSYRKFKRYVQQHQALIEFCEKLENVYTMIVFGQVIVSSVLICLYGYQILLAKSSLARRFIFIFLLIGSMLLLLMFTYSCDGIIEQSDNVAVGAYSALWTIMPMNGSGKMLRTDLILVIERSRRVCCLTANGFFPISLETYTTILSTAVSYFTLLRNHVEEVSEVTDNTNI